MHLGTTPWQFGDFSATALCAQARLAEQWGYDSFWLPENHFNAQAIPDPLMLLASCAAVTERLALGTTSYLLTLRNPLQAAEQVAVLDQLSNGRVILGIGRGYAPAMLAAFKVPARDKRKIFEACLQTMIAAWSGTPMAVGGASSEVVELGPLPVQRPHPPIWIAAFGPKALAQAGRLGLPYLASPMESLDELERNLTLYRQAQPEATSPQAGPEAVVPIMRSVFVSDDSALVARVAAQLDEQQTGLGAQPRPPIDQRALIGSRAAVAEQIAQYRSVLGMTHLIAARPRARGISAAALTRSAQLLRQLCPG